MRHRNDSEDFTIRIQRAYDFITACGMNSLEDSIAYARKYSATEIMCDMDDEGWKVCFEENECGDDDHDAVLVAIDWLLQEMEEQA